LNTYQWTRSILSTLVGVFLLVVGNAKPAFASGIDFQTVSQDELKMTSEPKAPGAPAVILFREVDRDDTDYGSKEDNYVRIKILTEEGRKYADIEIPYLKDAENIVNLKARSIRPDGTIANFEGKPFDKTIVKARGLKYQAKTLTLPDVQVGSVIEYLYTDKFAWLRDSQWILSHELFTKSAKFSLNPSPRWACRWSWNFLPPGTVAPKEAKDKFIRLESANIPAFQVEDYMPPETELKSRVDFIYAYEFSTDQVKYWKDVGKAWNEQLETFLNKRKAMEQAVAQIVSPSEASEVKLQKIYTRVQQFRNTSYEVEKTEKQQKREKLKDANNVEELWKLGYGNGGDLTWLFLGLVRAAGFDAYGVWTANRRNYLTFHPESMEGQKLYENIVLVKLNGKDLYFDPGTAFAPYGLLPWIETGVKGLKLDKDGGSWVTTTMPDSSASHIERTANLKLIPETDSLEGKLTVTYTGLEAQRRRVEERNDDEADRKKFLEDDVKDYIPTSSEITLTNKPDWASSSNTLVAEFDVKIPGWVTDAGRRALLPIGVFSGTEKHLFDHAERRYAIYFQYPSQKIDDVTIELPEGWTVSTVPQEQTADGHVITYTAKATFDKNKLHLTRKLDVNVVLLDQRAYPALRTLFMAVRTGDEEQVVLQPGATTASN